jgi:hypothetical protein
MALGLSTYAPLLENQQLSVISRKKELLGNNYYIMRDTEGYSRLIENELFSILLLALFSFEC